MTDRGWHQVDGKWARSLGERGLRVRLFQNRRGGVFFRSLHIDGRKDRKSLGTTHRKDAEQFGRALLHELQRQPVTSQHGRLTLGSLIDRYLTECPGHLDNGVTTRADAVRRTCVLAAYFGRSCEVDDLSGNDVAAFTAKRRAGGIKVNDEWTTASARARSAEADLVVLYAMLSWAATVRVAGRRLLASNPLMGVRRAREPNPHQPVATWERFVATRTAMRELATASQSGPEHIRWVKLELALVLAEATARRISSIRQLRWEDVDWEKSTIRWRAEADKKRHEGVIPMPDSLFVELRQFQRLLGAIQGWVFSAERNPAAPMDRHLFDRWLAYAEKKATLPKLVGGLWHPYRRMWATARKHLPIVDVAAAGGWKDTATLLKCYQQPTNDGLLAVMSGGRKVRDVAVLAGPS
jgi:integrase